MSNEKRRQFNFSHKILLGVAFGAFLPLLSLWAAKVYFSEKLEGQIEKELSQAAISLSLRVNDWTEMNKKLLQQHARLFDIKSFDYRDQHEVLKTVLDEYEWAYSVYTVDEQGYIFSRSDNKPVKNADGSKKYFRGDRKYIEEIFSGDDIGSQVLLSRRLNLPAFILCSSVNRTRIVSELERYQFGALCMATQLTSISEIVENLKIGETGHAVLLDDNNQLIAHGDRELSSDRLEDFSDEPILQSASNNTLSYYTVDGEKRVVFSKTTESGWTLLVERDFKEAYFSLLRAEQFFFVILGATLLISISISLLIARNLARPIEHLTMVTGAISRGELDIKIRETSRNDEIGHLARAIERMSISVSLALKRLKKHGMD